MTNECTQCLHCERGTICRSPSVMESYSVMSGRTTEMIATNVARANICHGHGFEKCTVLTDTNVGYSASSDREHRREVVRATDRMISAEQTIAELLAQLAELEGQEPVATWMGTDWNAQQQLIAQLCHLEPGTDIYAKPVPAEQQPVEVMLFQLKHPDTGESRTVAFTRSDIADGMEDVIFEKLGDLICDCQPVGETNVVDCNCGDYINEFELVNAAPQPPVQQAECPHGVDDGACKECHVEQATTQDEREASAWIEHGPSKPCPFSSPYTSRADIRLRDGTEKFGELACNTMWFWYEHDKHDYDVVAYRVATRPAQTEQSAVVQLGIRVEKLLCSKLGIEWTATGISIESLVDRLAASPAQTEQWPVPGLAEAPSRVEAVIVAIRDLWDEDECPAYPVVAKALREMLPSAPIAQTEQRPVAWLIDWPEEPELGHYFSEEPNEHARSRPLYAAPIVQTATPAAQDVSGLVEALRPFAEFVKSTDPAWSDDRRISTLNYDFTKLTLGIFRKALAAYQAAQKEGDQ